MFYFSHGPRWPCFPSVSQLSITNSIKQHGSHSLLDRKSWLIPKDVKGKFILISHKAEIWSYTDNGLKLASILQFRPRPNQWCHWLSRYFSGSWWKTSAVTSLIGACLEESSCGLQFRNVIQCGFTLFKHLTVSINIYWLPHTAFCSAAPVILGSFHFTVHSTASSLFDKKCIFWSHWALACLSANPLLWRAGKIYVLQEYCTVITFPH